MDYEVIHFQIFFPGCDDKPGDPKTLKTGNHFLLISTNKRNQICYENSHLQCEWN